MKILFIGDIVGKPGRNAVSNFLPDLKETFKIDYCIANGENAAGGFGLTEEVANKLFSMGIDLLTSGNHIWDKKEVETLLQQRDCKILRPANYPSKAPGKGSITIETPMGADIGIINLSGRVYIDYLDCPFTTIMEEIKKVKAVTKTIIVDMHGEATSEKVAMGWYLDGKVSAVLGTHTHIQTADERVLPEGTAYITDVGMTGPKNSVIGLKIDIALNKFLTKMPKKFEVAKGPFQLNGVVLDIDEQSGKTLTIERIQIDSENNEQRM